MMQLLDGCQLFISANRRHEGIVKGFSILHGVVERGQMNLR